MFLIKGILEGQTRLRRIISYDMDVPENNDLDTSDGVLVEDLLNHVENPKRGKGYTFYINPQTKEQWYEEYDRPYTQEELLEIQNEKIDLLLMNQLEMEGIL